MGDGETGLGPGVGVPLCPAWLALGVKTVSHATFQTVVRREDRHGNWICVGVEGWGASVHTPDVPVSREAW